MIAARILLDGIVQGVGYRWFTIELARRMKLSGWVRNRMNGDVEVFVEGEKEEIEEFIEQLKIGPRFARVEFTDVEWKEASGKFKDFTVRH